MNEVPYKGYVIEPHPFHLKDGNWDMNVFIWKFRPEDIRARHFFTKNTFRSEQEAIGHCINFGKQIIDGQVMNCTVADL